MIGSASFIFSILSPRYTKAPGIGAKTAARIILELKDKISKELGTQEINIPIAVSSAAPAGDKILNDALAALAVLGFSSAEIAPILKSVDVSGMTAEQIIKTVLKSKA